MRMSSSFGQGCVLFRARPAKLYVGIIIWTATGRTEAVHIIAHVMIAELADLGVHVSWQWVEDGCSEHTPDSHRRMVESRDLIDRTPLHREDMSLPHRHR